MFRAVGCINLWEALQTEFEQRWPVAVTKSFCRDKLDELAASRNRVAHTAISIHIVRSSLIESVEFISVLGDTVSLVLSAHFDSCMQIAGKSRDAAVADE